MAAYRRVYDSRYLQADCQEPGSSPEPYSRQSSMGYLFSNVHTLKPLLFCTFSRICNGTSFRNLELEKKIICHGRSAVARVVTVWHAISFIHREAIANW